MSAISNNPTGPSIMSTGITSTSTPAPTQIAPIDVNLLSVPNIPIGNLNVPIPTILQASSLTFFVNIVMNGAASLLLFLLKSLKDYLSTRCGSGRGTGAHIQLTPRQRCVLEKAKSELRIRLCTQKGFPDVKPNELEAWVEDCWKIANNGFNEKLELTDFISEMITSHVATTREALKKQASYLLMARYGFVWPMDQEDIEKNKRLVIKLLNGFQYIYKDCDESIGMYEHPILANVIVGQFFNEKGNSDGVTFADAFSPVPDALIALIFTVVHCAIEEWRSGVPREASFSEREYSRIYDQHLDGIKKWKGFNDKTGHMFAQHQQRLFDIGSNFANVGWGNDNVPDPFAVHRLKHAAAALGGFQPAVPIQQSESEQLYIAELGGGEAEAHPA